MSIFKNFIKNESGVMALVFALSIPVIIGSVGIGVDMSKAYHTKNKLEKTLDAAALAAASTNYTKTSSPTIDKFVEDYVKQNFKDTASSEIDLSSIAVKHDVTNNEVIVDGVAKSTNSFMSYFNRDYINVAAQAVAREKLTGVEVVLVLDNSKSMRLDTPSRATELRKAAKNFVDVLYDTAKANGGRVKIGIVPYSTNVNVGPYGIGKKPGGGSYDGGYAFVNNPNKRKYTTNRSEKDNKTNFRWGGCVMEHEFYDGKDHDPKWPMEFKCHDQSENRITAGDECHSGKHGNKQKCTGKNYCKLPNTIAARGNCPQDIWVDGAFAGKKNRPCGCPKSQKVKNKKCTPNPKSKWKWKTNHVTVNQYCPTVSVLPMVSNKDTGTRKDLKDLIDKIQGEKNGRRGATQSDLGMAWAYHLLSPERPFVEGSKFGSSDWTKVVVFMSDGNINARPVHGPYYLRDRKNKVGKNNKKRDEQSQDLFESTCKKIKSKGSLVYTVQFGTGLDKTNQDLINDCASDPTKALKASSGKMLYDAFDTIAKDLGTIFLAQ